MQRKTITAAIVLTLFGIFISVIQAQTNHTTYLPLVLDEGIDILDGQGITVTVTVTPTATLTDTVTPEPTETPTPDPTATPNTAATVLAAAQATLAQSVDVATVSALQTDIAHAKETLEALNTSPPERLDVSLRLRRLPVLQSG